MLQGLKSLKKGQSPAWELVMTQDIEPHFTPKSESGNTMLGSEGIIYVV